MPILGIVDSSKRVSDTGAMFPLQVVTVGAAGASSITFSNIPQTYAHLQIRFVARNAAISPGNASQSVYIRFNGDTGSNYAYHYLNGNGTSASAVSGTSQTLILLPDSATQNLNTAGLFSAGIVDILDYSSSAKNTTIRHIGGAIADNEDDISLTSGLWINTSAITSITFTSVDIFVANSRFSLYGIKSA